LRAVLGDESSNSRIIRTPTKPAMPFAPK